MFATHAAPKSMLQKVLWQQIPMKNPNHKKNPPQRLEITAQNTELCIFRTTIYHIYKAREQSSDPTRDDVRVKCLYCVFNVTEEREKEQERERGSCMWIGYAIGICIDWYVYVYVEHLRCTVENKNKSRWKCKQSLT